MESCSCVVSVAVIVAVQLFSGAMLFLSAAAELRRGNATSLHVQINVARSLGTDATL